MANNDKDKTDAFLELHQKLKEGKGAYEGADPEDKNEYRINRAGA